MSRFGYKKSLNLTKEIQALLLLIVLLTYFKAANAFLIRLIASIRFSSDVA